MTHRATQGEHDDLLTVPEVRRIARIRAAAPPGRRLRAAIYCRISRDREGAALGVERQESECRQLCEQRGWQVVEVFVDNDLSAYSGKRRPRYRDMLRAIEGQEIDVVVAWHNDRLHRSPAELEQFIPLCETAGVTVQTVKAGLIDLSTPAGRMMARQFGAIARYESEHRSERVRSKHEQIAARGGWSGGGLRPYGYEGPQPAEGRPAYGGKGGRGRDEPRKWRIRADEAEVIRDATRRVLAHESVRSVAADLDRRGVPTANGGRWWTETLRCILYSPRIAGQRWHHGEVRGTAEWPAIITPAESVRLRQLLGPRVHGVPTRRGRPPHLLTGILVCGRCGRRMKSAGRAYSCRMAFDNEPEGCFLSITRSRTDSVIGEAVLSALDLPALRLAVTSLQSEADADIDDQGAIEEVQGQLTELGQLLADGAITVRAWQAAVEPLEQRIKAAEASLARRVGGYALADALSGGDLRERWPDLSVDRRRAVITALVDRIVVQPARTRGAWEPDRLGIVWKGTEEAPMSDRAAVA